jgi:nitric oxide dioxygenase
MLNTVTSQGTERDVYWIHAAVNRKYLASKKHANDPAASNRHVKPFIIYEKPTVEDRESKLYDEERYITLDFLQRVLPSEQCDFYFCGPEPFMRAVSRALIQWEITEERIH